METNDYQLEDAENAAVERSRNLKRGLAAGAAVLGVGAASAYGASVLSDSDLSDELDVEPLTEEDVNDAANAFAEGAIAEDETSQPQYTAPTQETDETPVEPEPEITVDPELQVNESAIIYDENGDIMASYDAGTYDGKDFIVVDSDGNGRGDILAYDENGNGIFEDNEIMAIDNETYELGQGEQFAMYQQDEEGNVNQIWQSDNSLFNHVAEGNGDMLPGSDISEINNDFDIDDKTGEVYYNDLAENNPDYDNNGGEQYAGFEDEFNDEMADFGYTDPSSDIASYDTPSDGFDEAALYDA